MRPCEIFPFGKRLQSDFIGDIKIQDHMDKISINLAIMGHSEYIVILFITGGIAHTDRSTVLQLNLFWMVTGMLVYTFMEQSIPWVYRTQLYLQY